MRDWRINNPIAAKAIDRRRYSKERSRTWRLKNPEAYKALVRSNYLRNKANFLARNSVKRALKKQRTPSWLSSEHVKQIIQIYAGRPAGFHVDHIVPLCGAGVCGLHVPWNLQYLSAADNLRKSNKFE